MNRAPRQEVDRNVQLLTDLPIATPEQDLFERQLLAIRVAELAVAAPMVTSRVVGLTGACGAGKTSVLQLVSSYVANDPTAALLSVDAQLHATAQALMADVASELNRLLSGLGVVDERDKLRNTLVSYGGVISSVIRIAGVKVDVAGALQRSADSLRKEIAHSLESAGKRVVMIVDHLDQLPATELGSALAALRMYSAIPYFAIVIAVDRHELATRPASGAEQRALERLLDVELVMSPVDPETLSRVIAVELRRIAARIQHDLEPVLTLFDPDGVGLRLIETPRDAKRAINALAAMLPMLSSEANPYLASLELLLLVLCPELDAARVASSRRVSDKAARQALFDELARSVADRPRAAATRDALRVLVLGD